MPHLAYDPTTGHLLYNPTLGHLATNCAACCAGTPATATLTATVGGDDPATCDISGSYAKHGEMVETETTCTYHWQMRYAVCDLEGMPCYANLNVIKTKATGVITARVTISGSCACSIVYGGASGTDVTAHVTCNAGILTTDGFTLAGTAGTSCDQSSLAVSF